MTEYTVIRSHRKTLGLEITREGAVLVRAPLRLPQSEIRRFMDDNEDWIRVHLEKVQTWQATHPEPGEAEEARLRQLAMERLSMLTAYYGDLMGLHPTQIRITGAKTRFGSCSTKNHICYSWRLMQYPQEAIEYVVVHELAHIRHKNHGADFYRCIAEILPDYKKRIAMLKR